MDTTILTALAGIITTGAGSCISWLLARKKYNSEVDSNLIENMQKSLDFYMKLSDDNKQRLDEALKKNAELEDEVTQLRQQVFDLMHTMCIDLACKNRKLAKEVKTDHKKKSSNGTEINKKA